MTETNLQIVKLLYFNRCQTGTYWSSGAASASMKDLYNEHQFQPRESHPH